MIIKLNGKIFGNEEVKSVRDTEELFDLFTMNYNPNEQPLTLSINTPITEAEASIYFQQTYPDLNLRGLRAIGVRTDSIVDTEDEENPIWRVTEVWNSRRIEESFPPDVDLVFDEEATNNALREQRNVTART